MKHLWIALLILALTLGASIAAAAYVNKGIDHTLRELEQVRQQAVQGDFEQTAKRVERVRKLWDGYAKPFGMLLTHDEGDQVSRCFAALHQYALMEDKEDFAAAYAELKFLLEHIREMQEPNLHNIL